MFTGIVEELGSVEAIEQQSDAIRLTLRADVVLGDVHPGDSIAVDGCCLTVTSYDDATWTADVMAESLERTSLGRRVVGDRVNLERAVRVDQRLGGHIVQGHVDGVGEVVRRSPSEHWTLVEVAYPPSLAPYLVEKGSITVDGISLTIVEVGESSFTVSLIPETLARTTLGFREVGEPVNLEADVIAKHVERLVVGGYADGYLARMTGTGAPVTPATPATPAAEEPR
ncbi:riboflavin synthase [Nocardioides alkalitolerans]|uniref:riboflavin synthase n=1 Tax=Nocardioides alkalitolerans TaxID=281714 RepID=UPI00042863A3|nr:riboflavin synthase [Nocardioides alkalitolerans]